MRSSRCNPLVLVVALAAVSSPRPLAGQGQTQATVTLSADRTEVSVGDTLRVTARADVTGAEVQHFDEPDLAGFDVISRQISRPLQFRFGFGNQQQLVQSTTIHTWVLRARAPGRHALGPLEVRAGGRSFRSNPVEVIVLGRGGASDPTPAEPAPTPQGPEVDGYQPDPQAFIRATADIAEPYVGQQVTISVYLYSRSPLRSYQVPRSPTTDGLWTVDLIEQRHLEPETQYIDGSLFRVYRIFHLAGFPLREGEITIGAPEVSFQAGSGFDLFQAPQEVRRAGVPIRIRAKPVPPHGAVTPTVGSYTLETALDRPSVRTGDAVTLTATVRGTGNVRDVRLTAPTLPGLEILQPRVEDEIVHPADRVGGTRRFEWLVVPQTPGTHTIPPFELHLFDPETAEVTTVRSDALTLSAVGAAVATATPDATAPTTPTERDPVTAVEPPAELGPLRTEATLRRGHRRVSDEGWYLAAFAAIPFFGLALLIGRWLRRRTPNPDKEARRASHRRLADAERLSTDGDGRAFYAAIAVALKAAVEARLGEPIGGLTQDDLRRTLERRRLSDDATRRLLDELDNCDFARFSSAGADPSEMRECLARTRALLAELDAFKPSEADS